MLSYCISLSVNLPIPSISLFCSGSASNCSFIPLQRFWPFFKTCFPFYRFLSSALTSALLSLSSLLINFFNVSIPNMFCIFVLIHPRWFHLSIDFCSFFFTLFIPRIFFLSATSFIFSFSKALYILSSIFSELSFFPPFLNFSS